LDSLKGQTTRKGGAQSYWPKSMRIRRQGCRANIIMKILPCLPESILSNKGKILKSQKGFSLIELIVVIAIIGIIAMFAIPALNHYNVNSNLKTAARDIASDIFNLKEKAVSENVRYLIQFDISSNQYTLNQGTYTGAPYAVVQAKSPSAIGSDVKITNAAFTQGAKIYFQTRGTADPGTVSVSNRYGSTATITVNNAGRTYVRFNLQ
jgi:type II secretion system protein H